MPWRPISAADTIIADSLALREKQRSAGERCKHAEAKLSGLRCQAAQSHEEEQPVQQRRRLLSPCCTAVLVNRALPAPGAPPTTIAVVIQRVEVVDTARDDELRQVEQFMAEVGFPVVPTRKHHPKQDRQRVGEAIPWVVTVVLAAPIGAFFAAIANEAGKDAYGAIKRWVLGLSRASAPHGYGNLEIFDGEGSHLDIREAALPEEAFAALLDIDWSSASGRMLTWSDEHGWVDATGYWETVLKPGIDDGTLFRSTRRPGDPIMIRREHRLPPPRG